MNIIIKGIEKMMTHYVEEVKNVVGVDGHDEWE